MALRHAPRVGLGEQLPLTSFFISAARGARLPGAPKLVGPVQDNLVAALTSYRSKARTTELMNTVAAKLTDADIADVSAYFSAIQLSVTPTPKP